MSSDEHSPTARLLAEHFPGVAAHLDAEGLEAISWELELIHARGGDEIHRQGSLHPTLLFLLDGSFALRLGDELTADQLGYLPPHSIVGEVSFFDGGPVTATIMVCSPRASALALELDRFERLAAAHPRPAAGLCRAVSETLAARLRVADEHYDRLAGRPSTRGLRNLMRTLFGLGKAA
jgi:CRP-like cAMP-binding protein